MNQAFLIGASVVALLVPGLAHAGVNCPAGYSVYDCDGGSGDNNCEVSGGGGTITCDLEVASIYPATTGADVKAVSEHITDTFAMWGVDGDDELFCCPFDLAGAFTVVIKGVDSASPASDTIDLNDGSRGLHLDNAYVYVYGQDGSDHITGSTLMGDYIDGEGDGDTIYGLGGDDTIDGSGGDDHLYGGDDVDTIHGDDDCDYIESGDAEDHLYGDANDDDIKGGAGMDTIWGGSGDDDLCGDLDVDTMYGDGDVDTVYGGGSIDTIDGGGQVGDDCGISPDTMTRCTTTNLSQCMVP